MCEFVYRQADDKDIEGMIRLLGILFSREKDFDFIPDLHRKALKRILNRCGKDNLGLVVVEKGQSEVLGMMTIQSVVSSATGELSGWVEDVVIDPSFQGKGLGRAMLEYAEDWATEAGITRLQLLADLDNQRALKFYKSKGWSESNMIHRKKMIP